MSNYYKVLLGLTAATILICAAAIIYMFATPAPSDRFTEFYLLGDNGTAAGYPATVQAGAPVQVTVGVVNHEVTTSSYRVNVISNGATLESLQSPGLAPNQKWEEKASFALSSPGENQTVQFYLYMNNSDQPYIKDPLTLRLNVTK